MSISEVLNDALDQNKIPITDPILSIKHEESGLPVLNINIRWDICIKHRNTPAVPGLDIIIHLSLTWSTCLKY